MSSLATNNIDNSCEGFSGDPEQEDNNLLTELNDVDLVMSLSPKSSLSTNISQTHIEQELLKQTSTTPSSHAATAAAAAVAHQQHNLSNFQHLQNLHSQHNNHTTFFNNSHSTPFSVTDILSPIEESYRKLEISGNPPSPYR